ncbi:hypothetical protein M9H77_35827 [Catharanthus roseus]|uniref:Uncharacterized protein n=1 Tax=Catharanthus roseus TaxID=4058 RepID=A0ACB9ZQ38_CATRO|nr:hypothetical protein M9H77_35827 [Catharanthus roseus]
MVEVKKGFKKGKQHQTESKLGPKGNTPIQPRFQGECFNYNKMGHKLFDCRLLRRVKANEANVLEDITKGVSKLNLYVVISEFNLIDSNPKEWWLDMAPHIIFSFTKTLLLN